MLHTTPRSSATATAPQPAGSTLSSPALEWLWQHLRDQRHPRILDCETAHSSTLNVLLRRGAKVYVAGVLPHLRHGDPELWDRSRKVPVFRVENLLGLFPKIPAGSLAAILAWHLLDQVPHESVSALVERLYAFLQPGGMLFCLLRQPYLKTGADITWWLESLVGHASGGEATKDFSYSVLTSREIERFFPAGSVKIYLTRSGRREVLALK